MDYAAGNHAVTVITQIVFVDLLLSGDNAVLIALVCRNLPPALRLRALVAGTAAAIALRTVLTGVAGLLMRLPLLEIAGAALLLVIAIKLLVAEEQHGADGEAAAGFWGAVVTIVFADLAMSLDNVVAIAGAANGSLAYLLFGLALSIPLLMFGSTFVGRLLQTRPLLVPAGAALLGWIAGRLAVSDPLWAGEITRHVPALHVVAPALCAVFVVAEGRIVAARLGELGPAPRLRRAAAPEPAIFTAATIPIDVGHGGEALVAVGVADADSIGELATGQAAAGAAASTTAAAHGAIGAEAQAEEAQAENAQADAAAPTRWQRVERIALKVYVPLVVVAVFTLLGWMAVSMLDIANDLPPPRHLPQTAAVRR
ncbi:integral membrane protein TerC family protein [mine drainage metagenome]|uniref:Integral membrane protein TerC family protein n=1 Tax=mine drainage metagenome TaxID=410659 RepID=A0A1J5Q7N9_9ZZZZ